MRNSGLRLEQRCRIIAETGNLNLIRHCRLSGIYLDGRFSNLHVQIRGPKHEISNLHAAESFLTDKITNLHAAEPFLMHKMSNLQMKIGYFVASAYSWSFTASNHEVWLLPGLHSTARCENQLSGAAPCQ